MKKTLLSGALAIIMSATAMAQHSVMNFAGKAEYGVAGVEQSWVEHESDTIQFKMNSASDADITLPSIDYNGLVIPSFTIHGATFTYDMSTRNADFEEQTFEETVLVNGEEKTITGSSFSGTYTHADKIFNLTAVFKYGKMPFPVTYILTDAAYFVPTGIEDIAADASDNSLKGVYDLTVHKVAHPQSGVVYIVDGKQVIFGK